MIFLSWPLGRLSIIPTKRRPFPICQFRQTRKNKIIHTTPIFRHLYFDWLLVIGPSTHLQKRKDTRQEQTAKPVHGQVKLNERRGTRHKRLAAIARGCHGDQALDAGQREGSSEGSIVIGHLVLVARATRFSEEGIVLARSQVVGGHGAEGAAEGASQAKKTPAPHQNFFH